MKAKDFEGHRVEVGQRRSQLVPSGVCWPELDQFFTQSSLFFRVPSEFDQGPLKFGVKKHAGLGMQGTHSKANWNMGRLI